MGTKNRKVISGVQDTVPQFLENDQKTRTTYKIVSWDDAPEFMKINPYITQGYRPYFSYLLCLKSLFRLHNEVNIIF